MMLLSLNKFFLETSIFKINAVSQMPDFTIVLLLRVRNSKMGHAIVKNPVAEVYNKYSQFA